MTGRLRCGVSNFSFQIGELWSTVRKPVHEIDDDTKDGQSSGVSMAQSMSKRFIGGRWKFADFLFCRRLHQGHQPLLQRQWFGDTWIHHFKANLLFDDSAPFCIVLGRQSKHKPAKCKYRNVEHLSESRRCAWTCAG